MREQVKELKYTGRPGSEGRLDSWFYNSVTQEIYHLAKSNNEKLDPAVGTDEQPDGTIDKGTVTHLTQSVDAFTKQTVYFDEGVADRMLLKRKRDETPINEETKDKSYEQLLDGMSFFFIPRASNKTTSPTIKLNNLPERYVFKDSKGTRLVTGYLQPNLVYMAIYDKNLHGGVGGYYVYLVTTVSGGGGAGGGKQMFYPDMHAEREIVNGIPIDYILLQTDTADATGGFSPHISLYQNLTVMFEAHHIGSQGYTNIILDDTTGFEDAPKAVLFTKNQEHIKSQADLDALYTKPDYKEGQWYIAVFQEEDENKKIEAYWKVHLATPGDHSLSAENPGSPMIRNSLNQEIAPTLYHYKTEREINISNASPKYGTETGKGVRLLYRYCKKELTGYNDETGQLRMEPATGGIFGANTKLYFNGRNGGELWREEGGFRLFASSTGEHGLAPTGSNLKTFEVQDTTKNSWIGPLEGQNNYVVMSRIFFYIPYIKKINGPHSILKFDISVENYGKVNHKRQGVKDRRPNENNIFTAATTYPIFAMYKNYDFFHNTYGTSDDPEKYIGHFAEMNIETTSLNILTTNKRNELNKWITDYYDGKGFIACYIRWHELWRGSKYSEGGLHNYEFYIYDRETNSIKATDNVDINYSVLYVKHW